MNPELQRDGLQHHSAAFDPWLSETFFRHLPLKRAGVRLAGIAGLAEHLGVGSKACSIAASHIGEGARPVRAILFDKGPGNNWPLGWHQDRTILVAARHEVVGFAKWTTKDGLLHAEPPAALLAGMVTLRLHLDDVDCDNAPLRVAVGSHLIGMIPEGDYARVVEACDEFICLASAGDIWAYSTLILHASAHAANPRRRRVLQVDYASEILPKPLKWAGV